MTPGSLLLLAAMATLLGLASARRASRLWLAASLTAAMAALAAAAWVLAGGMVWDWRTEFLVCGEPVHLRLDALSALFLALLAVVGGAGSAYAREYWPDAAHPHSQRTSDQARTWWRSL